MNLYCFRPRFLGMLNYYRKLISNFAIVLSLTELIKVNPNAKWLTFSTEEHESFCNSKQVLTNISALHHPISWIQICN